MDTIRDDMHTASGNPLVDLFGIIGSSRGKDLTSLFSAAYAQDRIRTLKILLWARDVRAGADERQTVRNLMQHLETINPDDAEQLIPIIPFFGRWDDLLIFKTQRLRDAAFTVIVAGLGDPSTAALVAKWLPRKGVTALALEQFLGIAPTAQGFRYTEGKAYPGKSYRKLLVDWSHPVEQQMCTGRDSIMFENVPSLAAARYQKAFNRRCYERYQNYKRSLSQDEAKINAAIYPYDVIKSITQGDREVAQTQWEALPNYLDHQQALAMVNVSDSMTTRVDGAHISRLDVSTSLGLYLADKAGGPFKDCFMTFSGSPKLELLTGDILSKHEQMCRSPWSMNTDLHGALLEILRVGKAHRVADSAMPKLLLILSDMEFDACVANAEATAMSMVSRIYTEAGYSIPKVLFWNLAPRAGNRPVRYTDTGTALVSGFSPAIMKAILRTADFSPLAIMEETIKDPRYDVIHSTS